MSPATRRALHHAERSVKSWPVQFWRFWTAPLTDKPDHDLSLTRGLAIGIFIYVWHTTEAHHAISVNAVVLLILAMAAAFGKATFTFFLTKWKADTSVAETNSTTINKSLTVAKTITEAIQARTDPDRWFEATP